jgi:uncharacterized protein YbaR (Trm112 family)
VFVELIELLRCPREHAESHLIAAAERTDDRHILDGVLGCPTCAAEFRIVAGVAHFDAPATSPDAQPDADIAMRLAALLDLSDARGFALLTGAWCAQLDGIQRISDTPIALLNPPSGVGGIPAGVIECADVAPFAPGSLRAAALDSRLTGSLRDSIVRAVRTGGRILCPVSLDVPRDVNELARDDQMWVGEKAGSRPLVELKRSR